MAPRIVGAVLFALGVSLRIAGIRELRKAGVTDQQFFFVLPADRYTNSGPFKWTEHPCYLGSLMMCSAVGMMALGWGGVVLSLPAWPFYEDRIRVERQQREFAAQQRRPGA